MRAQKVRLVAAAFALFLISTSLHAQTPEIDAIFADFAKPGSPGCALSVIRGGKTLFARGYGLASLEHGVPITPETVFDIGSTSKQFTAASILLLAQDGKLTLDDPVRKHIPEFPDDGTSVTLNHLLHHTSGVRDYINLMMLGGFRIEDHTTAKDALAAIGRQKSLDFPPGSEHSYSNSGYFLLAEIVERVSGKPMREFARERIFEPLGMKQTQILDDHTRVIAKRASSYEPREEGGFALATSAWEQTGDGAVQTTVGDLALWDANFYDPKVGGPKLIEELQRTAVLTDGTAIDYARGLVVDRYRGLRRVQHGGAWVGFRAQMARFPDARTTIITLCNLGSTNPNELAERVADHVLGDRLAARLEPVAAAGQKETPSVKLDHPERYVGIYWSEEVGLLRRIEARDGKLFYVRGPGNETELASLTAEDRFEMVGVPERTEVGFHEATATSPRGMEIYPNGQTKPSNRFREVAAAAAKLDLAEFVGAYASAELATRWRLLLEGGVLTFEDDRGDRTPLTPVFADAFQLPGVGVIRMTRDAQGKVAGLTVSVGRARNLVFERVAGTEK
jgi:CubicO group peptidase (beta-lactamase class C family)